MSVTQHLIQSKLAVLLHLIAKFIINEAFKACWGPRSEIKKRDLGNNRWCKIMMRGWQPPCHACIATHKHSGILEEEFKNIWHIDIQFLGPVSILFHGFQVSVVWQIQIQPLTGILEI